MARIYYRLYALALFGVGVVAVVAGWLCDRETCGDIPHGRLPRLLLANTYGAICDHAAIGFVLLGLSFLILVLCNKMKMRWIQNRKLMAVFMVVNAIALVVGTIFLVGALESVLNVGMDNALVNY